MEPPDGMALLRSTHGLMAHVADTLGLSRPAVIKWKRVPAELLPHVERITGIPRWALRPDICPPPAPFDAPAYVPTWQPPPLVRRGKRAVDVEADPDIQEEAAAA
jgi:hypothetical protein